MRQTRLAAKVLKRLGYEFTDEDLKVMNPTSRGRGAIGKGAVVPRLVRKYASTSDKILDFGAGKGAFHAQALMEDGYDVTAYEFGANMDPEIHDPKALSRKYDLVYASNVLNVQPNERALHLTVRQIAKAVQGGGRFIGNLPATPRKGAYDGLSKVEGADLLKDVLGKYFSSVEKIHGTNSVPVFLCKK